MGEIHQVVDQELRARTNPEKAVRTLGPAGLIQTEILVGRDEFRIAGVGRSHPDPDQGAPLFKAIGRLAEAGPSALRRYADALAVGGKGKSVIPTNQGIALETTERQRIITMRANSIHRDWRPGFGSVENRGSAKQRPLHGLTGHLFGESRDIPAIPDNVLG